MKFVTLQGISLRPTAELLDLPSTWYHRLTDPDLGLGSLSHVPRALALQHIGAARAAVDSSRNK